MLSLKIDSRINPRIIFQIHLRPIHVTTELSVSLGGSFHLVTIPELEAKKLHLLQIMVIQVLLHTEIISTITLPKQNRSTKVEMLKR